MNVKNLGFNLRLGYTHGFNAGLTGSENSYLLPEEEWNSSEKLDPGRNRRVPELDDSSPEYEYAGEKKDYYKAGYNWGYLNGCEVRANLKNEIPDGEFERSMSAFANSIEILYLQINDDRYLHGVTDLSPDEEKNMRTEFFNEFLQKPSAINTDKAALGTVKKLITENKIQQAIDNSAIYFRDQKNLIGFDTSLSLKSRLMNIREASKEDHISREEYFTAQTEIMNTLTSLIDEESLKTTTPH